MNITITQLIELAAEFGLPCIVRGQLVTIIGEHDFLEVYPQESQLPFCENRIES